MSDLQDVIERLTSGPGPRSEPHSASDEAGWVRLESGPETKVRLSPKTGLDETTRASLEGAIAEALDALLKQDSPFARTLVDEVQQHLDLDEVQERMLDQARTWQERSSSLQERIDRARNRRA